MNKEQIHCGRPTCDMKDCACAKMFSKQTWSDSVDKLNENNKTTAFDSWLNELEDGDQPTCNVENPEDCENCGS
jgi:hypothetical protein